MEINGKRSAGILLHITSLPSEYGIGDLGPEAYAVADKLAKAGATLWQVLPLGPTGYGNSPYAQRSAFAGNELLLSPELLYRDGYLSKEDLLHPDFPSSYVDFQAVEKWKMPRLKKAAKAALQGDEKNKIKAFRKKESFWIEDYALFMVLYEKYNDARWHTVWDEDEGKRNKLTLSQLRRKLKDEIDIYIALQYLFSKEMTALLEHVHSKGLKLIGDIPIFAGADSADTWSHLELFKTDSKGHYSAVSGVPPDNFSATGQLWGNPVYDWKKHEEDDFAWWKARIRRCLEMTDIVRIDHFRGFDAYYEIKASAKTAEKGVWKKSPGKAFFASLEKEMGKIPIIAEDLGWMTPSVAKLRERFGFPGMKIAQFGFSWKDDGTLNTYDDFLMHNYARDFVAYTGTHDNNTIKGWYSELNDSEKHHVREYLASPDDEIVWSMIRSLMMSNADTVIIPMQDILELGSEARMNYPSTCNDKNWTWRMERNSFDSYRISRYSFLARISGRNGLTAEEDRARRKSK
ncbi:MAG: 4-alpha-glucanotransferase [Spirochaetes bacterium]|uniref:4-alpha-glucanotransferase n=1 Tax=Candidatus Ornithospirochaeta stercoripullorum TaxID=2840899 RepID=A0A9D9H5E1_9SPIO|nr:4-alpha-glucanotransferase [Candidatus Ornithospirochaeta stercoripullorum]